MRQDAGRHASTRDVRKLPSKIASVRFHAIRKIVRATQSIGVTAIRSARARCRVRRAMHAHEKPRDLRKHVSGDVPHSGVWVVLVGVTACAIVSSTKYVWVRSVSCIKLSVSSITHGHVRRMRSIGSVFLRSAVRLVLRGTEKLGSASECYGMWKRSGVGKRDLCCVKWRALLHVDRCVKLLTGRR
jgi:hypothetical protein